MIPKALKLWLKLFCVWLILDSEFLIFMEKEMATHSSILSGKSHGWRSLVDYSPWSRKESDTTENYFVYD